MLFTKYVTRQVLRKNGKTFCQFDSEELTPKANIWSLASESKFLSLDIFKEFSVIDRAIPRQI